MAPPAKEAQLSAKDQSTLRNISKLFDDKKYKKAYKTLETFLRAHPDNVDGHSFKSLILYHLGRKEEALDIARQNLRKNLSNSMAWHTLGTLNKMDRNYAEALKCFKAAGKHNKENQQIMKDLVTVQLYQRDLPGLRETYSTMLQAQPAQKGNWVGLIVSYHLLGNYKQALNILEKFVDILDEKDYKGIIQSELTLYRAMLLDESGEYDATLKYLKDNDKVIVDKLWSKKKQAEILLRHKKQPELAEKIYMDLVKLNPEDHALHIRLIECRGVTIKTSLTEDNTTEYHYDQLTDSEIEVIDKLNQELKKLYPKSLLVQRLPLNYLRGDSERFKSELFEYVKQFLRKGIPSLFNSLKSLYKNETKVKTIEELMSQQSESLKSNSKFTDANETKESPSVLLWSVYYLAQHFDRLGEYTKALECAEQAVKHTPTCLDIFVVKAKIYKHQGDFVKAFEEYDYARRLDLADRYLNTKAAKYAMLNNDPFTADSIFSLIKDDRNNTIDTVTEFQCMWYEKELGECYQRSGQYGRALKAFYLVEKHFDEFQEDQFDFHYHMQKKLTLRSYVEFLRWEDLIYQNKPYTKAAKQMIQIYLNLINKSKSSTASLNQTELKNKEKYETLLNNQREQHEKAVKESKNKSDESTPLTLDEDPNGEKLVADSVDFLTPASKFMKHLLKFNSKSLQTHILACEIYLLKKKYLMVLKSLLAIKDLVSVEHPTYHYYLIKLFNQFDQDQSTAKEPVKQLINEERSNLINGNLSELNSKFLESHKNSIQHRFSAAKVLALLEPSNQSKQLDLLLNLDGPSTWKDSYEIYQYLIQINSDSAEKYRELCIKKYSSSTCFKILENNNNNTTVVENNNNNNTN